MIEKKFIVTDKMAREVFLNASCEKTIKLVQQYSILTAFNQGVVNVCNSDLFRRYETFYFPVPINSVYVEQEKSKKQDLGVIDRLDAFLNSNIQNNKVFALFGAPGSGKSIATQKIISCLWERFVTENHYNFIHGLEFDKNSWFSFYIDISMFNGEVTKTFVEVALNNQYTLSYPQIDYLKKHCRCLIILDGFELISDTFKYDSGYANFLQEWDKSKFFITCRSDVLSVSSFDQCFVGLKRKDSYILHYYLNKFSYALLCKTVIDDWFNENYDYIKNSLRSYRLFKKKLITYEEVFNSLINYMMQIAFYMYSHNKLTISWNNEDDFQRYFFNNHDNLFWKFCLINLKCHDIDYFPKISRLNNSYEQCFFWLNFIDKTYVFSMERSFINYFVAKSLWLDLTNNFLKAFIDKLRNKNLAEELEIMYYLVEFFDKLKDSEKNSLHTLIKIALMSVEKTDFNVFSGLNAILKQFNLVNDGPLIIKPEPLKSDDFQEKSLLFSYSAVSFASLDSELTQPNKVNLICNGHGFSLLCFELYSPTKKTIGTYYVKLPEEEAKVVVERNLPTFKDFKKTDIVDLFSGTSQDVPEARKENIKKLFLSKSSLLFI